MWWNGCPGSSHVLVMFVMAEHAFVPSGSVEREHLQRHPVPSRTVLLWMKGALPGLQRGWRCPSQELRTSPSALSQAGMTFFHSPMLALKSFIDYRHIYTCYVTSQTQLAFCLVGA